MQTFLPYPSFLESAKVLDNKRLGKQRVETYQIIKALNGETKGWVSHPCTKMWRNHEYALAIYGFVICTEWINRGFKDSLQTRFALMLANMPSGLQLPSFIGNEDFHLRHQSKLVYKLPQHYKQYFPNVPDNLKYIWPIEETK